MSKSLGNLVFVGDLCKEWDPAAVRLALLAHHYREDWDWRTDEDMPRRGGPPGAVAQRARPATAPAGLTAVRAALDDDLDTPRRCAALDDMAPDGAKRSPTARGAARHRHADRDDGGGPVPLSRATASGPGAIRRPSRKGCTMAGVISVGLPDGSTRELAEGTTAAELARSIGPRLAKAAVAAMVDGHEVDLDSAAARRGRGARS